MFKNLFAGIFDGTHDEQVAAAGGDLEREAEAKRERIEFHRARVRNGPVQFARGTHPARRKRIDARSHQRKARNHRVRTFLHNQMELAVLRGHLQAVGALPYADHSFRPGQGVVEASVQHFLRRAGIDRKAAAELNGPVLLDKLRAQIDADRKFYLEAMAG